MAFYRLSFCLLSLLLAVCSLSASYGQTALPSPTTDTTQKSYDKLLEELEKHAAEKNTDSLGTLLDTITFRVNTTDTTIFKDGVMSSIELDSLDKYLPQLVDKNEVVINEQKVTVIIDYPLANEYRFTLSSASGFTREKLVKEISKAYRKIYKEEEATATIKTVPQSRRTELYNRNQTNGKYGIWGHDFADLSLAEILIYRSATGEIILSLNIYS